LCVFVRRFTDMLSRYRGKSYRYQDLSRRQVHRSRRAKLNVRNGETVSRYTVYQSHPASCATDDTGWGDRVWSGTNRAFQLRKTMGPQKTALRAGDAHSSTVAAEQDVAVRWSIPVAVEGVFDSGTIQH
jgi:hypothetical protein